MSIFKPVTLITGASSGIGAAFARIFAEHGHEIALVARRESKLATLADEIAAGGRNRPYVVPIDLARTDSPARISHELLLHGLEPAVIVNNAGFGLLGPAAELDRADQLAMIDLNVRTLTDLSLRWIASLERHRGGLLNIASIAGFFPGPGMAVYYATKAYVLAFSEALHRELAPRGVRVTVLCPGPVPTEFQARAGIDERRARGLLACSAEQVARAGFHGFMRGRRLVVPGLANRLLSVLPRFLPRSTLMATIHAMQQAPAKAAESPPWPRRRSHRP